MKKYLSIILVLFLVGCEGNSKDDNQNEIQFGLNVAVVNGCQYVIYVDDRNGAVAMVHAGNCNNPEHKNQ